jgi:hypothetical protein
VEKDGKEKKSSGINNFEVNGKKIRLTEYALCVFSSKNRLRKFCVWISNQW